MLNHFSSNIPILDQAVHIFLSQQITDSLSPFYGGQFNFRKRFSDAVRGMSAAYIVAYYTPGSQFFGDELMLDRANLCVDYHLRCQHDDGTVDLLETNFHDTCENAFMVQDLGPALQVLRKFTAHTPKEDQLEKKMTLFVRGCADSHLTCGFGTPNHRWVVSSSLSLAYCLLGDERYLEMVHKYLSEGIDCDEYGEYTERSAGIYNTVCNGALDIVATELNKPELWEHICRNLRMAMHYFEPDDTICTLNSTRQDLGKPVAVEKYYRNFLRTALVCRNPEFGWMADYLLQIRLKKFGADPDQAVELFNEMTYTYTRFLLDPGLTDSMCSLETRPVLPHFDRLFEKSGIYRYRNENLSLTLLKNRPEAAKLQFYNHTMLIRAAGSYFGQGQFRAQKLIPIAGGYRMEYSLDYTYLSVLEEPRTDLNFEEMKPLRKRVNPSHMMLTLDFVLKDQELQMTMASEGCENIPMKLEFILDPGGVFETSSSEQFTKAGDYVFWKQGDCRCYYPDSCRFTMKGGFFAHHYGSDMRFTAPQMTSMFTVNCTAFSPVRQTVIITAEKGFEGFVF